MRPFLRRQKELTVKFRDYGSTPRRSKMSAAMRLRYRTERRSHDGPLKNGMGISPYYTLTIGGEKVPVYSTRCAKSVHSFAWAEHKKDG